jgi:tRNA A37 N6-isopentenylltransferase MiaA
MGAVLRGELTLEAAAREIKHHTHRFIRHQYAWFRPSDPRIEWFDVARATSSDVWNAISS